MNFLIISHVLHKKYNDLDYGYAPYIREMNIWTKRAEKITIVAPCNFEKPVNIFYNFINQKVAFDS